MLPHQNDPEAPLHLVRPGAGDCVAVDARSHALFAQVDHLANCDTPVLITGETGTGKEVVARRLFRADRQRRGRFVPVNCGALTETLAESELFGHRRGAFTGALTDKAGLVEEANGGVLFLDEIGDMPPPVQVRLLRFLDSGEARRVGDTLPRELRVRIVAATNRPLERDVREGRFRADLFYRINVIGLHVPPLRERRADIPALAAHALARAAVRLRKNLRGFSSETIACLMECPWPGNVRQLQNAVECAAFSAAGEVVARHELPPDVAAARPHEASLDPQYNQDPAPQPPAAPCTSDRQDDVAQIALALVRASGNQRHAAAALGISRTTLWRRLRQINGD